MIKVEKLWSWLAAKGKGTGSSGKDGPLYRELPAIPEPKARAKARYTLVLISDSGKSRQIELSPMKLRVWVIALAAIVCLLVGILVVSGGFVVRTAQSAREFEDLSARVRTLQEELGRKEQALTIQEKRLKEMQETGSLSAADQFASVETPPVTGVAATRARVQPDTSALTPLSDADRPGRGGEAALPEGGETASVAPGAKPAGQGDEAGSSAVASREREPHISFDAQDLTASQDTPNTGTLSFKLVKDQGDIRFGGYLFVLVEMADRQGEAIMYAYPEQTRLGEGDLPTDYRVGQSIEFRYNSRVKLDYKDARQGASLARVSILLYGDDGKIVYQRGFDPKDMKVVSAKALKPERPRTKQANKRQAM